VHKSVLPLAEVEIVAAGKECGETQCGLGDVLDPIELGARDKIAHGVSPSSLCGNTTIPEAGSGESPPRQRDVATRYDGFDPVPGIAPVDGWTLLTTDFEDSDHFWYPAYVARGPEFDVKLDTSRSRFTPSQKRFAWFVHNDFPRRSNLGPIDDTEIELALTLAGERLAA